MALLTRLKLMAHLGPVGDRVPAAFCQTVRHGPRRARVYAPLSGRVQGAYFVVPGLHYLGPADERMDRFCRALADAGFFVYAPHLATYEALAIEAQVIDETVAAFGDFWRHPSRPLSVRPAVFTISFGSLPGLALAAHPDIGPRLGTLVVFGGAVDVGRALRFAISAHAPGGEGKDPLNLPAVFLNLRGRFGVAPGVEDRARAAWHQYVRRTWGRPEMKAKDRYIPLAEEMGAALDDGARDLFLLGCGAAGDPQPMVERALGHGPPGFSIAARLPQVACEVVGFHGLDDDVIPHEELDRLGQVLPPGVTFSAHKTGWVDHTRSAAVSATAAAVREARTMWTMLARLDDGARKKVPR